MNHIRSRWAAIAAILLGSASYGLLSPLIKLAFSTGFDEIQVTVSQVTMGTCVLWCVVLLRPQLWSNPFRGPWLRLACIGIFGLVLTTLFYNTALKYLDASLAIVLLFQFTWMTLVWEAAVLRNKPNRFQLIAVAVIIFGTVLAVGISAESLANISLVGILMGLAAGLTYSAFIFFTGRVRTDMHAVMKSVIMLTAALPILFILYPPLHVMDYRPIDLVLWGLLLGIVGQVLPTVAFNYGVPRIGSGLAAILGAMELPVAVIGAYLILRENVTWMQWSGVVFILLGIMVAEKRNRA